MRAGLFRRRLYLHSGQASALLITMYYLFKISDIYHKIISENAYRCIRKLDVMGISPTLNFLDESWLMCPNLVPRACDPREGTRGSGIIRCRKSGILAKIELRIPYQRPIRFLPETDYPRASRSFQRIAGSGNEIECVLAEGSARTGHGYELAPSSEIKLPCSETFSFCVREILKKLTFYIRC
jgi:hypothetical protein